MFGSTEFMPHGHCYFWRPELVWTMAVSDALIAISYAIISITLYILVKKIRVPFSWIFVAFGTFIFACGATHLMEVYTLWYPAYWISAFLKGVTAVASVSTCILVILTIPKIYKLNKEILLSEKRRLQLINVNSHLEEMVRWRTKELEENKEKMERYANDLERSNGDLEQFAAIVSHDLKEPLRTVANYIDLIRSRVPLDKDEVVKNSVNFLLEAVKRMNSLIDDLLEYSHVCSKREKIVQVDLEQALDNALAALKSTIDDNNVKVIREKLPIVYIKSNYITQIFQNLIGNAIKYRSKERPEIIVRAEEGEGEWIFSVRDNGIGFDQQYATRIFKIFQRLHGRSEYSGTGVGLAICKKIVVHNGGRIWAVSTPKMGSVFYFTLPILKS